jgi:hypothetical protein
MNTMRLLRVASGSQSLPGSPENNACTPCDTCPYSVRDTQINHNSAKGPHSVWHTQISTEVTINPRHTNR